MSAKRIVVAALLLMVAWVSSCTKDDEADWGPIVETTSIIQTDTSGVEFKANLLKIGTVSVTEFGIVYDSIPINSFSKAKKLPLRM